MSNYNYNNYNSPSPGPSPGPGRKPPQGDDPIEMISWLVDIGLIFAWFPVGLFLTIAHATGRDFVGNILRSFRGRSNLGTGRDSRSTARDYRDQRRAEKAAKPKREKAREKKPEQKAERKTEPGVHRADAGATLKTVFGWLLAAFGLISVINAGNVWAVLTCIAVALGGGALALSGHMSRKKEAAFRRCITVSGTTGIVNIAKLAKTLGMEGTEADRILTEMIDRGYYGARAYIDHERGLLVIEPEAMRDVFRAEDEARAKAQENASAEKQADGHITTQSIYDAYVEKIHQADIDIDDEVMSEKIRRMQTVTAAIFQEVEAHPEKKPQIQRFMNYYLPTTLKLLNSYARIEAQGVTGENMAKAKADIERIADTLVAGYEKQLDTLYRAEAVDIAGDVNVIENMMKRDGLTGRSDFDVKAAEKPEDGQLMGGH